MESLNFSRQMSLVNEVKDEVKEELSPEEAAKARQELQQLSSIIKEWKEMNEQLKTINEDVREKRKRLKVQEDMILRIMKKHNIGALDLNGSGGRILLRKSKSKGGMNDKLLFGLLSQHMKSEVDAASALKYITEHREAKVRESLLYEKE